MTKISVLLAQVQTAPAGAPASAPGGSPLIMVGAYLFLFGALYFLMIAPQRKKQKAHEKMMTELKSGDEVITTGGIYGTITSVKDDRFVVRIGDNNAKVEIGKGFISSVISRAEAP